MRIGGRKVMAGLGLLVIAAAALPAWILWGTDGLLAATLGTLLVTTLALGWLLADSHRQITTLLGETRSTFVEAIAATAKPDDGSEQLLRAVQAGFERSDHTLDTLVTEWRQAREEMLSSLVRTVEREIGVIGREVGVIGREVDATAARVDSALEEVSALRAITQRSPDTMRPTAGSEPEE